jgi:hypothetical protein
MAALECSKPTLAWSPQRLTRATLQQSHDLAPEQAVELAFDR